jgi:CHAT domain-containing protein
LASGAAVRDALPGSALIHLGCHATSDTYDVLDSALLLAGEDVLPLRELLASPAELLRAQLVVLSACQTSVLDRELPGESLNLTSGVLAAGANAVIGSLWPVDDAATATLMGHFYEALRGGTPPADALREAQRATAAEPGRSDPYFWAGFTYVGR